MQKLDFYSQIHFSELYAFFLFFSLNMVWKVLVWPNQFSLLNAVSLMLRCWNLYKEGFIHKTAKWGEREHISDPSPKGKGLGMVMVKSIFSQRCSFKVFEAGKAELMSAVCRHIRVICFFTDACWENVGVSMNWGCSFWPLDVKKLPIAHL